MVALKKSHKGRIKSSKLDGNEEELTWGELPETSIMAMKKS
jgi:hypothetical protein